MINNYNWPIDNYVVVYHLKNAPKIALFSGNKPLGSLYFKPVGSTLPSNSYSTPPASGYPYVELYYYLDEFQNVIDVLRNEKPLWLFYTIMAMGTSTVLKSGLQTGSEPVGEAEK
jgi:hypothetical protein